jgi:hypothetical protein
MRSFVVFVLLLSNGILAASAFAASVAKGVQVVPTEANRRVDITIDGNPFSPTSGRPRSKNLSFIRSSPKRA